MTRVLWQTHPCPVCSLRSVVEVDEDALHQWRNLGVTVQKAFPDWTSDQREVLVSGTHAACWDRLFQEGDE